jgi:hypothetical protein
MTVRRLSSSELPAWPRLLSPRLAAAYLSVSEGTLRRMAVRPMRVGSLVLYDRLQLDALVENMSNGIPSGVPTDWTELVDAGDGEDPGR